MIENFLMPECWHEDSQKVICEYAKNVQAAEQTNML